MPTSFLETDEDLQWLKEVYPFVVRASRPFACAIIIGNEDCPRKIQCYDYNHYKAPYVEWTYNEHTEEWSASSVG